MFEINLVPDIKAQLLHKQRMRNLVIFICILVAAGAAGVVAILGSVVTGQNIAMSGQDKEIQCRSKGETADIKCDSKKYGTAVFQIANLNEYLTIQDQMKKVALINDNKLMLSRVFGLLDVILPTGDDVVEISELAVDLQNAVLSFDAQGDSVSNIDYRALEVFKNTVKLAYFDYGRYMRLDKDSGNYVEIPTTCITEVVEDGLAYGIYHKGKSGCEAPLLTEEQQVALNGGESVTDGEGSDSKSAAVVVDVKILRDYKTLEEKEKYMDDENEVDKERYYFESECAVFGENGVFDEEKTRSACQLVSEEASIRDSANGRDSSGNLVLRFTANVNLNKEVFKFVNKHMRVVGPSKQNVTDSYTQIRNMFTERAGDCDPEAADYQQCIGG